MSNSAAALSVVFAVFWGVAACAAPAPAVSSPDTPKPAPIAREASPASAAAPADAPPVSTASAAANAAAGVAANAQDVPPSSSARPEASAALPRIPPGTAVLHIGDSFAASGFAKALRPRFEAFGVRYEVRTETSSFTTTWSARMAKVVADTQPDLVIINLGANEVSNTDPTTHAPHIRKIVRVIGERPCVWVSTPLWRKDTGINEVIRQNSAPCRFFDSDALVTKPIPRQSDHIHPTEAGGAVWADAFWTWLFEQRAPADSGAGKEGATAKVSPWRLKLAPPEEHRPHGSSDAPAASAPSP